MSSSVLGVGVAYELPSESSYSTVIRNIHGLWVDLNTCLTAKVLMLMRSLWARSPNEILKTFEIKRGK